MTEIASRAALLAVLAATAALAGGASGQSLKGSPAKLDRQNQMVADHGFTFLETKSQVNSFVSHGLLVPITPNADFELHDVSYPYARAEAQLFIERLAPQYHAACREKMVVTSLTRPTSEQPKNASPRSVHPTGTAVDLRRSTSKACRTWLENTLLQLDRQGVLDATRESRPAHYHIVIFPREYRGYVETLMASEATGTATATSANGASLVASAAPASGPSVPEATSPAATAAPRVSGPSESAALKYRVRSGDTLSTIAAKHGTTVARIKAQNGIKGSRIYAGQLLTVPGR
jgi:LysM repeat protein